MAGLVIRLARRILRVTPTATRDDAMRIARDHCAGVGWPWRLPVHVEEGVFEYYFMSNAEMKGGNVNIRVRVTDGKIVAAAFARR